jgi:hypothetical protein
MSRSRDRKAAKKKWATEDSDGEELDSQIAGEQFVQGYVYSKLTTRQPY